MNQMEIKRNGQKLKDRTGKQGGNRKPQTFKVCVECNIEFGPVSHLKQKFCSMNCKVKNQTTGRTTLRKTISIARSAQSLLRYHILSGNIKKPENCEECGLAKKIEGAHKDYSRPLDVRWLCRSCHVKWDKKEPKNATYIVARWEKFTGQKAVLDGGR